MLKEKLRNLIARIMAFIFPASVAKDKKYFRLWEKKGFHITPIHFYEPIPDTTTLKEELWEKQSELVGININEKEQIDLLSLFSLRYKEEYDRLPRNKTTNPYQYYLNNQMFDAVDAEILYCMNRHFKPKRIVEIGSGCSTLLSAQAILKNREEDSSYECEFVAIEPYPSEVLKEGVPGLSKLFVKEVQDVPLLEFEKLRENDVLFIDSSHVLKIGGDVRYEFLEILPRLQRGVLIHVHDIFLPAEYHKEFVLTQYRFWTEQYLLQAFLTCNDCFEVIWAGSYMHLKHPQALEAAFGSYKRNESWPGSFWMRKIK